MTCFEKILDPHPNNTETLKILGSLYAQAGGDAKKGVDYRAKVRGRERGIGVSRGIDKNAK